jgi:predicted HicB family RNase H-like nuclease
LIIKENIFRKPPQKRKGLKNSNMENLSFKKAKRKITMSVSIDKNLRENIIDAAEKEGLSISSFVEQIIRFAMPKKGKAGSK